MDFTSLLETNTGDIEKPLALPQGNYIWNVSKIPTRETSKNGEWFIVEFPLQAVEAEDDVDPDDLEAFGDVTQARNRLSFMFPTAEDRENDRKVAMNRLKKFLLEILKVNDGEDASLNELLDNSPNHQFLAQATHRIVDEDTYVDVKSYAAL